MNFPPINGVDEGSLLILLICTITGLSGDNHKFWTEDVWVPGLNDFYPKNIVLLRFVQFFIFPYAFSGLYNVYVARDSEHFKHIF